MSSISSLSAAVSALMSNQSALNTTAHNLSNVNTPGYVRQQVIMKDARYMNIGQNATTGFYVGIGVDLQGIRQIRDQFLDQSYRQENSRKTFYGSQSNAVEEIETILGETEGESFGTVLNELWVSLNELSKHPEGLETRGTFVESAVLFTKRAELIMDQLNGYQDNLNTQVVDSINEVNDIGDQINDLNNTIVKQELSGGNANDYRDQRNSLLDRLSSLVDIKYKEDKAGNVLVQVEGMEFVTLGNVNKMGIAVAAPLSKLVKPIWTHLSGTSNDVFDFKETISPEYDNDKGSLKGLLYARGTKPTNWKDMQTTATYEADIKPSIIMNAQAQFDNLIHGVVTMINDVLSPNSGTTLDVANAPYGLDGSQGIELFVRKGTPRYNGLGQFNPELSGDPNSLYSAGNIEINPEILKNYDKICLSGSLSDISDNTIVKKITDQWQQPFSSMEPGLVTKLSFSEYYHDYISGIGNVGNSSTNKMNNQEFMTIQIDNQRSSQTGVSSDEELSNMIKYQHAYNAAAKVVSVLDQMMEQIVQSLGLVGR